MSLEESLLGFDARELTGVKLPAQFLLRTDIDEVLSADTMIWPSVFSAVSTYEIGPQYPQPQWIGSNPPFWKNLDELCSAILQTESKRDRSAQLAAATWHTDVGFEQEQRWTLCPHLSETNPERRDDSWRLIGFDVTDSGFLIGLSNCGYGDEHAAWAAEWGQHLNRWHLFDDVSRAFEFRALTNKRVPEHAPFFVIGLWWLNESVQV